MAKFKIFKLHFTTPLHIGDDREDYGISLKTIQSDTFYAAITSCLAKLGKPIPMDGDLGCTISSLFPFYQKNENETPVYFFPKPLKQKLPKLENVANAKKIKKVVWLDKDYFEKTINGHQLFENDTNIDSIQEEYLTDEEFDSKFMYSKVSPRVTISRTGEEEAKPFYMDKVYFNDHSGMFLLTLGDTSLFEQGLNLLQYEGIGTDRNVGNGSFIYSKETIEIKLPRESDTALSLSIFIPENKEQLAGMLKGKNVGYDFTRRGGWITTSPHNSLRKNTVHAFLPASAFSLSIEDLEVKGKIVDLAPQLEFKDSPKIEHSIWRLGKSIFIPIKTEK